MIKNPLYVKNRIKQNTEEKKSSSLTCHLDRSSMHFILQQNHLFYLLCIFITQTISIPINDFLSTKQSDRLEENRLFDGKSMTLSTTTQSSSTSDGMTTRHSYDFNLKIIAILVGCVIFVFGVARLCVIFFNPSRSANNNVSSNRRTSVVGPQIATIRQDNFKPDLPPAYAEAITTIDNDESKLPSYDELRNGNT